MIDVDSKYMCVCGIFPSCGYHNKLWVCDTYGLYDHYLCFISIQNDLRVGVMFFKKISLLLLVRSVHC